MLLLDLLLAVTIYFQNGNSWLSKHGRNVKEGWIWFELKTSIGASLYQLLENMKKKTLEKSIPASPAAASVSARAVRKFRRNRVIVPQTILACSIPVKDVISLLGREPQMSKSTLIYGLYGRIGSDETAD